MYQITIKASAFKEVLHLMQLNHVPHLVDYMGEIPTPTNAICTKCCLEDSTQDSWYFYTFPSLQDMRQYIQELLDTLDLTSGGDDQYFDYNPAQLEVILYGLTQLDDAQTMYAQLKQILDNYFENDDLHEMDETYQIYLKNIDFENHSINMQCLEISNL